MGLEITFVTIFMLFMQPNITPILFFFQALFCSFLMAQEKYEVSGQIKSEDGSLIVFANVLLLDEEDAILLGSITKDDGSFSFASVAAGDYRIKTSFIGYEDYSSTVFTISENYELPTIILKESAELLDETTLISKKPTIVRKSDRLVFNVENTILSSGSTLDILKRTPGVVVNQDKITVRNEGVVVYLNNRRVQLDMEEVQSLLQSLGGDAIKSVEVLQNPPAEYDAEGGPVLNIITSKAVSVGYKGNINARGTYGIFAKHAFGTSHFFKSKKTNLFVNYSYNPRKQSHRSLNSIKYRNGDIETEWDQDFERKEWTQAHNANVIFDYQISDKTELNFAAVGLFSPDEFNFVRSPTEVTSPSASNFNIFTESRLFGERTNVGLDLKLKRTLEKGSLSTNIHFTTFNRERSQRLNSRYTDVNNDLFRTVRFNSFSDQDIEIYTGQLDYETTIGELAFQTGAKAAIIDSRSRINFPLIQDDGNSGLDAAQNDDFLYDENVFAGYISVARDWDKWSAKAGLRAEQTNSKGTSVILNTINELDYFEWFPSAFVQYAHSDNHSFSFDYSRRLDRPRYQDLNPFSYFLNENNFDQGNANLLPAFSHRFNLNYTLKGAYSFDVYYRDNGENIVILPFQDNENQVLRTVRQNALASKSWGIDFTHGRSLVDWIYFYTYLSAFHEEETFLAVESGNVRTTNAVDGFYAYVANSLTLSKDKTLTGEVSLEYFSRFLLGSYVQNPTTAINVGLQKTFWKRRGTLQINFNDLLNQANGRLISRYLNQNNSYRVFNETQNVQIGFTYKFGNFRLDDNNRDINTDEGERINKE